MNSPNPIAMVLPNEPQQDLARVFSEHRASLQGFLRKRLGEVEVEDAMQETFLRLLNYQTHHAVEHPSVLLYRIAEHVALDFARRARSHRVAAHCPLDEMQLLSEAPTQEQQLLAEQELELLIDAIERLTPRCQEVFLLSRMENMSYPQIAARCGISVKMVEKHISRALAELRARVGGSRGTAP